MPTEPMGPVVVGVDGSQASLEAVDLATEEAVARMAPLLVVHARCVHAGAPVEDARARRVLAVATARASAEHPGVSVSELMEIGNPADVLNEIVDMCLLVVGHRGAGGGPHAAWSVARIVQKAQVPVIVHRRLDGHDAKALPRPILVGVAGDKPADEVVAFAFAEAALRGAPLLAMRVSVSADAAKAEADRSLSDALAAWSEKYPDVVVTRVVHRGLDVALPLVTASRTAQLAVVGAARHGRPAWPSLASVSRFLIRRAHCPVAVVPQV